MKYICLLLTLLTALAFAGEEPIVIQNKSGKALSVNLIKLDGDTVHFKNLGNNKNYELPISSLAEDSQKKIKEWSEAGGGLSERFRMRVNVVKANKKSKVENYDDREVVITPKVEISNQDMSTSSVPVKAVMVILGRPVNRKSSLYVVSKEEVDMGSFEKGQNKKVTFTPSKILYDNKKYAQFGYRYYGHACLLVSEGKVIEGNYQPPSLGRIGGDILLKTRANKIYPSDFGNIVE